MQCILFLHRCDMPGTVRLKKTIRPAADPAEYLPYSQDRMRCELQAEWRKTWI